MVQCSQMGRLDDFVKKINTFLNSGVEGVGGFKMVGLWHFENRSLCG